MTHTEGWGVSGEGAPDREGIAHWIRERALALGFHRVGITSPAPDPRSLEEYRTFLAEGRHGQMDYLARPDAVARRAVPTLKSQGAAAAADGGGGVATPDGGEARPLSVVVVTHRYPAMAPPGVPDDPARGVIARYARGADYHDVIVPRLQLLHREIEEWLGRPVAGWATSDSGPLLERDLGRRAGLGWFGQNTLLIDREAGSWELLGALLLELELPAAAPNERAHCGRCTRCVDACPTGALLGWDEKGTPRIDARRCISYLTIEQKGAIPLELRPLIGNRVFGCDICQEVCPWNSPRKSARWPEPEPEYTPRAGLEGPELIRWVEELLPLSGKAFQRRFAGSPLARPRRAGLLRNLCVALGNLGSPAALPVLRSAMEDPHPLVREHAAWAVEEIEARTAREYH